MRTARILLLTLAFAGSTWAQPLPSEAQRAERIRKYEAITRDNPRDVEMWHNLASLYREAEEWDKAIAAETKALDRFPKYAVAWWGRGKARMEKQDYPGAVEDFSTVIKLLETRGGIKLYLELEQPPESYIDSYRTRGVALAHLNRYGEGIQDLSNAILLRKDDPKLHFERGYLAEKVGRNNDAIADYYRAGLLWADGGYARRQAEECLTKLDALGAKGEAAGLRRRMEPRKPKSDLP